MVCLGLEPGQAGWYSQTYPLSYGSTPSGRHFARNVWRIFMGLIADFKSNAQTLNKAIL